MIRLVVAPSGAVRRYSGSDDARTSANADGALVDALAQRAQQPGDPLGVVAGDDRPDVGQRLEHVEAAAGEVDGVDLDRVPAGLGGEPGADGDAAQGDRLARAARAEHEQPAVGVGPEVGERLQLAGRLVADAEHDRQVVATTRAGGPARSWRRATAATAGAAPAPRTARTRRGGWRRAAAGRSGGRPARRPAAPPRPPCRGRSRTAGRAPSAAARRRACARRRRRSGTARAPAGPMRATARPGRRRSIAAATGEPTTSADSSSAAIRRATRRFVLARIWPVITPAGRCVASTRCRPRLRPRRATSTTPSTNSGISLASAANSSTTISRLGGVSGWPLRSISRRSLASAFCSSSSRWCSSAFSEIERPAHLVAVEVGDHADGVRQVDALLERGAALVVDEQERDPLRAVHRGQADDHRLQELATCRRRSCRRRGRAGRPGGGRARTGRRTACRRARAGRARPGAWHAPASCCCHSSMIGGGSSRIAGPP